MILRGGGAFAAKNRVPRTSLTLLFHGGTNAEKIRVQEILGLCCLRGGPVLKKFQSKKFLDSVVWGGGGPVLNKLETKKFLDSVNGHNQPCILLPKQLLWKKCVTSNKNLICITIAYGMSRKTEDWTPYTYSYNTVNTVNAVTSSVTETNIDYPA